MPYGKGTYGSKVGRPKKKLKANTKDGTPAKNVMKSAGKVRNSFPDKIVAKFPKKKK